MFVLSKIFGKLFFKRQPVEIGFAISLDGLDGHSLVRKNDLGIPIKASSTLRHIRLAKEYGLYVTVNTTLTNAITARELPDMYDLLNDIGIDRWQIDIAYLAGRYKKSSLATAGLSWLDEAKDAFKKIVAKYLCEYPRIPNWRLEIVGVFRWDHINAGFKEPPPLNNHPCSYQFGSVIVERGDEVRFCPSLRTMEIGKIGTDGFDEIYKNNKKFKVFLDKSINDLPCKDCRYGRLHRGGCRANSFAFNKKIWDKDPICCALAPFVEQEIIPLFPTSLQKEYKSCLQEGFVPK